MSLYWLSFADPDLPEGTQFLGVAIVETPTCNFDPFIIAVQTAHYLGINPGGECMGHEIPDYCESWLDKKWISRLLSRAECEELERELERRQS